MSERRKQTKKNTRETKEKRDKETDEEQAKPSSSRKRPKKKERLKPEKRKDDDVYSTPLSSSDEKYFSVLDSGEDTPKRTPIKKRVLKPIPEESDVEKSKASTHEESVIEADDEGSKESVIPTPETSPPERIPRRKYDEDSFVDIPLGKPEEERRPEEERGLQLASRSVFNTNLRLGGVFIYLVIPPDGGYAWLILLISFLCQVIVDGIMFSLGIVLPYMAKDLGSSTGSIALVASTQIGPISSAFINKFGFRPVALMGAILSMCNITIASFSPNLAMLLVFYSVLGGCSLSMIWVSSQLIIGYYFEKYRPIASGVSCSGAGVGVLLFSWMNGVLVQEYGWRNTSRIHVGFLVFVLLFALTYIEVKPTRIGRMLDVNQHTETETESSEDYEYLRSIHYSRMALHGLEQPNRPEERKTGTFGQLVEMDSTRSQEVSKINESCQRCCPPFRRFMERRQAATRVNETHLVIKQDPLDRQDIYYTGPAEYDAQREQSFRRKESAEGDVEIEILPQSRRETMRTINYNLDMMNASTQAEKSRKSREKGRKTPQKIRKKPNAILAYLSPSRLVHPKIKRAFSLLFDFKLLYIMEFQVLLASAFFFPMGFNIPFVYSKVRAEVDFHYAQFISPTIGLSNFLFRIISGFIAFKYKEYTTYICGGGITFGGAATLLSAFYGIDKVWFQFLYAVCFGIAPAFYSTLRAIIYVRSLGLAKLTNAFGLTAMAMGLGVFIGTFTGGILIQCTGNYTATYTFSGLCMMLAGTLKLILPTLVEWKQRREDAKHKVTFISPNDPSVIQ